MIHLLGEEVFTYSCSFRYHRTSDAHQWRTPHAVESKESVLVITSIRTLQPSSEFRVLRLILFESASGHSVPLYLCPGPNTG